MNASYSFLLLQIIYDIERRNPFFMGINLLPSYNKFYNSGYLEHSISIKQPKRILSREDIFLIELLKLVNGKNYNFKNFEENA